MTAAAMASVRACGVEQAFIVHAGGAAWALPARCIETVFRVAAITPVPLAPPVVVGLVNLRGRVVVAVDLAFRILGASGLGASGHGAAGLGAGGLASNRPEPRLAVAVGQGADSIAFLVERAGDVIGVTEDMRLAPPAHVAADLARLTAAWFKTAGGLVPLLDMDRLIEIECDRRNGLDRRALNSSGAKP